MTDQGNWYGAFKAAQAENEKLLAEAAENRRRAFFAAQALGGLDDPRRWEADKYLCEIIYSGGTQKLGEMPNAKLTGVPPTKPTGSDDDGKH